MTYEEYIKYATQEQKDKISKDCVKQWDETLDKMIFLFREAHEDTCTKINSFDEQYDKMNENFEEK